MSENESNAYVLGTEREEMHRLGLQHQVWASEARTGWTTAKFGKGDTILDLGSGPGFCSFELAYMVGQKGKVIAVDKSAAYLSFINDVNEFHKLNIETILTDFNELDLPDNSLDGIYCRWAMAWIMNPEEILAKVVKALKPRGKIIIHEYFDWSTFQTEPHMPALMKGVTTILKSFSKPPSNINVGRELPTIFNRIGLDLYSQRGMHKMPKPDDLAWQWPYSFLNIFMPKLIESGQLTKEEVDLALDELILLSKNPNATIFTPMMVEVIGEKKNA